MNMKKLMLASSLVLASGVSQARTVEIVRTNFDAKGFTQSVELAFGAAGENETNRLFVVYGTVSGGDTPAAWEHLVELERVPPETTALTLPMPDGWETTYRALRCYLAPIDLPYDDAVEYLASTGKEYIDTGCTHTAATRVECLVYANEPTVGDYNALFGSRGAASSNYKGSLYVFSRYNKETALRFARGDTFTGKEASSTNFKLNRAYWLTVEGQSLLWTAYGDSKTNSISYTQRPNTQGGYAPMMLFSLNETATPGGVTANTACNTKMWLWSFKMTDGATVQCDFVPVTTNGVGCLYDRVSRRVLGNISGEGAFTYGKKTVDPTTATATAVYEATSARTIEITGTNFVGNVATSLDLTFSAGVAGRKDVLFVSYGPVAGGDGDSGWAHCDCLGDIDSGTSAFHYDLPSGWGTAVRALRFFFAAPPTAVYDSRIDYIESTGREWINTGVKHKFPCYVLMTLDVLSNPVGDYNTPFGSRKSSSGNPNGFYMFTRYNKVDKPGYCFGQGEVFGLTGAYPHDVPLTLRFDNENACIYSNRVQIMSLKRPAVTSNSGVGPILLFTMNETSTADAVEPNTACLTKMRLRSFLMTVDYGATMLCDFVPVMKNGVGMLYDRVSKTLKGNDSGEGAFICGPRRYDGETIRSKSALFAATAANIGVSRFWYRAEVTFAGYGGSTSVGGVPAQVLLSETAFAGFRYDQCSADGSDIRFFTPEGVMLPHEIDAWDPAGTSRIWVRLPALDPNTGAKILMCWGATSRTPAALPASDVWSDYLGVWHLNEASGTAKDSGPHGYDAVPQGAAVGSVGTNATGVGVSRYIPGGYFEAGNMMDTLIGQQFTVSGWYRVTEHETGKSSLLFSKKNASWDEDRGWYLAIQEQTNELCVNGGKGKSSFAYKVPDLTEKFRCIMSSFDGKTVQVDVSDNTNLTRVGPLEVYAPQECDKPLRFFHNIYGEYTGFADELRIRLGPSSADARLAEFIAMARNNFVTFGPVEPIRRGLLLLFR